MKSELMPIDADDVQIQDLDPDDCEDCDRKAKVAVMLDIRAAGTCVELGRYCRKCATVRVAELKKRIPSPTERSSEGCHGSRGDGECYWKHCPQERDGEPGKTGRNCPLIVEEGPE